MLEDKLCQIGLTQGEAKIYVELLKIGPQAVSIVAKQTGLNRTTSYSIIKSLKKKGLVSSFLNNNVRFIAANDPNSLISYIDGKCRTYDYYRTELLDMVPRFRELKGNYDPAQPVVRYFDGFEGVKYVMYDALNAKKEYCEYLPLDRWFDCGFREFALKIKQERIEDRNLRLRAIVPDKKEVRDFCKKYYDPEDDLTEFLFVPDNDFSVSFENQIIIYDGKMAIIYLTRDKQYAVLIESPEIYRMEKGIFEMLWKAFK